MKNTGARFIIILALCVFIFPVFADPSAGSTFKISHAINVSAEYHFEFWKSRTQEIVTSVTITGTEPTGVATLGILYNKDLSFSRLEIEVSELTQVVAGNIEYLDFIFQVYKPNTSTPIEYSATVSGHGAGTSVLAENKTFTKYNSELWNKDEIADFVITIDDTNALTGNYIGSITFTYTT